MVPFPNPKAHAVQIAHTIYSLAEAGAEVHFFPAKYTQSPKESMAYYGLATHPNLHFCAYQKLLQRYIKRPGFLLKLWESWRFSRLRSRSPVFYLRDGADSYQFAQRARQNRDRWNARVVIECHRVHRIEVEVMEQIEGHVPADKAWVSRQAQLEYDGLRACDAITAISQSLARSIEKTYPVQVHPTILPSGAQQANGETTPLGKRADIVYAGQLYAWKGLPVLIEAMQYCPGYRLNIVGGNKPAELNAVLEQIISLGLEDRITLLGHRPHNEVASHIATARCAVIPLGQDPIARLFTSPIKVFECMAGGVPIVAANYPTIREVLQHEHNALLFDPASARDLACKITELMRDDAKSERLRLQALSDLERFTWSGRAEAILAICDEITHESE